MVAERSWKLEQARKDLPILNGASQTGPGHLVGISDASWSLDKESRINASGGIIMHEQHYIKSLFRAQRLIVLSWAHSELSAILKYAS